MEYYEIRFSAHLDRISFSSFVVMLLIKIFFCFEVKLERICTFVWKSFESSFVNSLLTLPFTGGSRQNTTKWSSSILIWNFFECGVTNMSKTIPSADSNSFICHHNWIIPVAYIFTIFHLTSLYITSRPVTIVYLHS